MKTKQKPNPMDQKYFSVGGYIRIDLELEGLAVSATSREEAEEKIDHRLRNGRLDFTITDSNWYSGLPTTSTLDMLRPQIREIVISDIDESEHSETPDGYEDFFHNDCHFDIEDEEVISLHEPEDDIENSFEISIV